MGACEEPECRVKRAKYNYPKESIGVRCKKDALPGMVDVLSKRCSGDDNTGEKCTELPYFNYPNKKGLDKCRKHKHKGMIDKKHPICDYKEDGEICGLRASFGEKSKRPHRCSEHAGDLKDTANQKCEFCERVPAYNFPGLKRLRCFTHKIKGMIDVINRRCEFPGCSKMPIFAFRGEKVRRFCVDHKDEEMVDIKHKFCEYPNCPTRACFNYPGEKSKFCYEHKKLEMINVTDRRCEGDDCPITCPIFNNPGESLGRFCFAHKTPDMVDVMTKMCIVCNKISAGYGPLFGPKKHCNEHKLPNEFKKNNPVCESEGCNERAMYTNDGTNYPRRCEEHVEEEDVNIVEKNCLSCGLSYLLNEETSLCDLCNEFVVKKAHHAKEKEVIDFLKLNDYKFMSTDTIPEGACSKYRPDGVLDFNHFIVVVEVDEYQHSGYNQKCELARMIQLHQDFGGIPIVFIRFNPDNYSIENCHGNFETVKPNRKLRLRALYDLLGRLNVVKKEYETGTYQLGPLMVCYMFYDGYSGEPELKEINILNEIKKL